MSRVAKNPVVIPAGVEVKLDGNNVTVKGSKGTLSIDLHAKVEVKVEDGKVLFGPRHGDVQAWAQAGTARSLVNNMVVGVTQGFERKLELVGVGYRAKASGTSLNLAVGLSHPVEYQMPEGVSVETPSQSEVILRGISKQVVGEAAGKVRSFRPPEPYKGKGIRYSDEQVLRKEAKKK